MRIARSWKHRAGSSNWGEFAEGEAAQIIQARCRVGDGTCLC